MDTYKIFYMDDDSAVLKDFLCEAENYCAATKQLIEFAPHIYYYEFEDTYRNNAYGHI